jgi:recombinational DNA repair protein (RecF pathway)
MYSIYHTEGFILDSYENGEADRVFRIFTRDFGMIYAKATGIRKESSKLCGHLQTFSLSEISLVRGRDLWRITSAREIMNLHRSFGDSLEFIGTLESVFRLLFKMVYGEEKNEPLYEHLSNFCNYYIKSGGLLKDEIKTAEKLLLSKILFSLGYIDDKDLKPFISSYWDSELLCSFRPMEKVAVNYINKAIEESQM